MYHDTNTQTSQNITKTSQINHHKTSQKNICISVYFKPLHIPLIIHMIEGNRLRWYFPLLNVTFQALLPNWEQLLCHIPGICLLPCNSLLRSLYQGGRAASGAHWLPRKAGGESWGDWSHHDGELSIFLCLSLVHHIPL